MRELAHCRTITIDVLFRINLSIVLLYSWHPVGRSMMCWELV